MYEYILFFTVAFIIAFCFTPIAEKLAWKFNAIDIPRDARRVHKKPIPRFGGLAVYFAFNITILLNIIAVKIGIASTFVPDTKFYGMLIGGLLVEIIGILDDIYQLTYKPKFAVHVVAAVVAVATGTNVGMFENPFTKEEITNIPVFLSVGISIFWIVGLTNALNLIDGLDGLAAGVASIASLSLFVISIIRADMTTALVTSVIAGSVLGFFPYNYNPARIFMADSGAPFLGYILAVISIQGTYKSFTAISVLVPVFILAVPLFDTLSSMVRRVLSGKSPMMADRGHLHHKLIDLGLGQKKSVSVIYMICAIFGLVAIVLADKGPIVALAIFIIAALFFSAWTRFDGFTGKNKKADGQKKGEERLKNYLKEAFEASKAEKLKVITVFGTRPEAVKMAPLVKALKENEKIDSLVCVTGQHREMLDQVMDLFDIKADYDLDIMKERQTPSDVTQGVLTGFTPVLEKEKPHIVLVHGDTATTFVSALACFYQKISVGHVEAGLRTYDKYFPYPEEVNRLLTTALSDLYFAPTANNRENLLKENIKPEKIYVTGNTVIDVVKTSAKDDYVFENDILNGLDYKGKRVIAVTAHRRENLGKPLENICNVFKKIAEEFEDVLFVYSVHLNPAVQETAKSILGNVLNVLLIDPLSAYDIHNLMYRSYMVVTDSGGLQEEAPALGKPVIVCRNETERPEAVEAGTVRLAGTEYGNIYKLIKLLLTDRAEYEKMAKAVSPYGDGKASQRIVEALLYEAGLSDIKCQEFSV